MIIRHFLILVCVMCVSPALSFEVSDIEFEVLTKKPGQENSPDLLFTVHQVQRKTQSSPALRISAAIRASRTGEIVASRTFDKSLVFDLKQHNGGALTYSIESNLFRPCGGFNNVIVETNAALRTRRVHSAADLKHTNKHDFDILPGGNIVFNSYEPIRSNIGFEFSRRGNCLRESVVQEVNPKGAIEFEWHSIEDYPVGNTVYERDRPDYAHLNSTDLSDDGKLYAFSLFGLSSVAIVSRSTTEVLATLGGAGDFTFVNDPLNGFCGQHQAEWVAKNRILLFDNGNSKHCRGGALKRDYSRVVEYELDFEQMTATLVWSYENRDIHGVIAGGVSRLKNGNTLIAWGSHAKNAETAPTFSEVTREGEVVWEARVTLNFDQLAPDKQVPRSYRIYETIN